MNKNELRIIGGKWRSRKILFAEEVGLRPTHNRIRETLFNWLQPVIENAVCLDVFAGSGALGFEALSRGAKSVTFFDISTIVMHALKNNAGVLQASNAEFFQQDFLTVEMRDKKFDIVFCDPPFEKNLLLKTCEKLVLSRLLNPAAKIYLECKRGSVDFSQLPSSFSILKHKQTQTVEYLLCEYKSAHCETAAN